MCVTAVVGFFILIAVPSIVAFIVTLGFLDVFHELGDSLVEKFLDVLHAADISSLERLYYLAPSLLLFLYAVSSNLLINIRWP